MATATHTTPSPLVQNPAVLAAAELATDGAITPALLADVAATRGLPLYVAAPVQSPAERRAADDRINEAVREDRERGAENARRRHAAVLAAAARGEGVAVYADTYGNPVRVTVSRRAVAVGEAALATSIDLHDGGAVTLRATRDGRVRCHTEREAAQGGGGREVAEIDLTPEEARRIAQDLLRIADDAADAPFRAAQPGLHHLWAGEVRA
jgi:hypothetical protein